MGYGMKGHVGIGFQSSFGTANVSSFHYFPIINESLSESIERLKDEANRGRLAEGNKHEGMHSIAGDIVVPAHPILLGKLLKGCLGQSSSTLVASHYSHDIRFAVSDFDEFAAVPPMTIEVYRDGGSAHQYYDCLCNQLAIEVAHGAIIKATASIVGASFAKVAKTTPSYLIGSDFVWHQSSISLQGSADGAIDELVAATFVFNNQLEGKGTLDGTKKFNRIKRTAHQTVEVAGTMLFANDQEFDHFRNQAVQRAVVTVTGQAISSGYNAVLEIDIPSFSYIEFPVNIGGMGLIEAAFKAEGDYNVGSASALKITLSNTAVSYAI